MLTHWQSFHLVLHSVDNNEKAKPVERWRRKVTDPRFLGNVEQPTARSVDRPINYASY